METHRFKVGQQVEFIPSPGAADMRSQRGRFEVVRLLPAEGAENQYRVKSKMDGHERVVKERELS